MKLFEELKRRNVFRIATAYVLLAWIVVQVTDSSLDLTFSDKNSGQLTTSMQSSVSKGKYTIPLQALRKLNTDEPVQMNAKFLLEMFALLSADEADFYAWEQLVVLHAEKVGCCMIIPQLMS